MSRSSEQGRLYASFGHKWEPGRKECLIEILTELYGGGGGGVAKWLSLRSLLSLRETKENIIRKSSKIHEDYLTSHLPPYPCNIMVYKHLILEWGAQRFPVPMYWITQTQDFDYSLKEISMYLKSLKLRVCKAENAKIIRVPSLYTFVHSTYIFQNSLLSFVPITSGCSLKFAHILFTNRYKHFASSTRL